MAVYQTKPHKVYAIRWEPDIVHPQDVYDFISARRWSTEYMSGVTDGRFYLCKPNGERVRVVCPGCWVVCDHGLLDVWTDERFHRDFELAEAL